jgi:hypothetical protein
MALLATEINWADLNGEALLADGDIIKVDESANSVRGGMIEVGLVLAGVQWWKGLLLRDGTVLAQCQDQQVASYSLISFEAYSNSGELQFWKAKTLGVHTLAYWINYGDARMRPDRRYTFTWMQDTY